MKKKQTSPKKGSSKAGLVLGLLFAASAAVSLHFFHEKGGGLLKGPLGENYLPLWIFGLIALSSLVGGLIRRRKVLGFVLLFLRFGLLALQFLKTDLPIHALSLGTELLGFVPLGAGKILSLLAGLTPLPAWFPAGAVWAGGILAALSFWFLPGLFGSEKKGPQPVG